MKNIFKKTFWVASIAALLLGGIYVSDAAVIGGGGGGITNINGSGFLPVRIDAGSNVSIATSTNPNKITISSSGGSGGSGALSTSSGISINNFLVWSSTNGAIYGTSTMTISGGNVNVSGTVSQSGTPVALSTRNINTGGILSGGGDLSADRTISLSTTTLNTNIAALGYVTSTGQGGGKATTTDKISFTADGGGNPIDAGSWNITYMNYAGTFTGWEAHANATSTCTSTWAVYKNASLIVPTSEIDGGSYPSLAAQNFTTGTVSGFTTTTFSAGDTIGLITTSTAPTCTWNQVNLLLTRTL